MTYGHEPSQNECPPSIAPKTAIALSEQQWPAESRPLVSIICLTFNHGGLYRKNAWMASLKQETDFKVEIIIHDDASTDDTKSIVQGYKSRYPQLFRVVQQAENQFRKVGFGFCKESNERCSRRVHRFVRGR